MPLFIDSSKLDEIKKYMAWGIVSGCTTNPKILATDGEAKGEAALKKQIVQICEIVRGPVSVEIVDTSSTAVMIAEGEKYHSWCPEYVVVKVPMCKEGMPVIHHLAKKGVPTNVTCMMMFNQAYLAARAGATYVSLFVGRIRDMGYDPYREIKLTREVLDREGLESQIIAGSIRHPQDVAECLWAGTHVPTVTPQILEKMIWNPQTDRTIDEFAKSWADFNAKK